jgi:alkanesulfonate monooxygenase SsuD/methylene tetrahydromethanopterin reductase-like flavin-dependent oxidoreductase (luciferase family)
MPLPSASRPCGSSPKDLGPGSGTVSTIDVTERTKDVTFSGDHYQLIAHRAWPPATQRPRPPILVGGNGHRLLRMAAARADTVGLSGTGSTKADGLTHEATGFPPEAVDARTAVVRAASRPRDVELHALIQHVTVTDDPTSAAARLRKLVPELSVEDILATPYLWIGTVDSICDQVRGARERWGLHILHRVPSLARSSDTSRRSTRGHLNANSVAGFTKKMLQPGRGRIRLAAARKTRSTSPS